jgi:hypothetical protein
MDIMHLKCILSRLLWRWILVRGPARLRADSFASPFIASAQARLKRGDKKIDYCPGGDEYPHEGLGRNRLLGLSVFGGDAVGRERREGQGAGPLPSRDNYNLP